MRSNPGLIYLDSAASSQKPDAVLEAMLGYYREYTANIHRGIYRLSEEATRQFELAREKVARFIGAPDPACCIFTRGTTESINLLAYSWGERHVGAGDCILLTAMEHHSNLVPWQQLALRKGAELLWLEVDDEGRLDLSNLDSLLARQPRLVTLTWVSNVFGTINPVAEIARRARQAGAVVLLDGAQGVPHLACDVKQLECDFMAFSGHKMLGPTGIGVLWGRRPLLEDLPPFHYGGDMIMSVRREKTTFADLPQRLEAGTPHIAGAIGLGAAVDVLTCLGMEQVRAHERELLDYAIETLGKLKGMRLLGPAAAAAARSGVLSFDYRGIHPHDLATLLDREGICVRAGHHCCQPLMRQLGMPGTVRASFYIYNTPDDVDRLACGLVKASEVFSSVLPA
ncbi:MAG: cysteine desulfurase [Armatimonadetes bacterium]|nr:cysteine desulfurase [Armatimonadota bacterium]